MYAITRQITSKTVIKDLLRLVPLAICACLATFAHTAEQTEPEQSTSALGASPDTSESQLESDTSADDRSNTEALPSPSALQQQERNFDQLLAQNSLPEEVVWLDIKYPGAASSVQSIALRSNSKTPITQGAALIIPDTKQHADWPVLVHPLRNSLPFAGWTTLALTLPWPSLESTPERQLETKRLESYPSSPTLRQAFAAGSRSAAQKKSMDNKDNADQSANAEDSNAAPSEEAVDINLKDTSSDNLSIAPYPERALVHIHAGINYLAQQGFQNTALVAIGESAELAIKYLQSRESEVSDKGLALILIEPALTRTNNNDFAQALGSSFPAPVLDIYNSSVQTQSKQARLRKASARAGEFKNYQQLKISAPKIYTEERFLDKRINDWLNRHAPGQEQN